MGHPWYAFYPKDYRDKTSGLTMLQDCAYRRLMDEYYINEEPLEANASVLFRICRAFDEAEQAAVLFVLEKFFVLGDDGWHNLRIDEEIIRRADITAKRVNAGKLGGKSKNKPKTASATAKAKQMPQHLPPHTHTQSQKIISSLRSDSGEPPVITLPTNRFERSGEEIGVSKAKAAEYAATFPAVDVPQQLRQMRQWLIDHRERRKTAGGMAKFINGWLSREQDKASTHSPNRTANNGKRSANDKWLAAAESVIVEFVGRPEGGDDSGIVDETGGPLLPARLHGGAG